MKRISLLLSFSLLILTSWAHNSATDTVIAPGKMPNMIKDNNDLLHVVFGKGDSILYVTSKDGKKYSTPALVAVLPKLFASAMRGPQIAAAGDAIVITACTQTGNIFSYYKDASGKWSSGTRVNAEDETAKEALMALSADGQNAFAVWLGVKKPKGQEVCGAISNDGGRTWEKNVVVYASPDGTVCECCKPSVLVKGSKIYVMFRNWLNGSRDLYLVESANKGRRFEQAQKLGTGTWKLNGCPMDGGGLAVDTNGVPETVWRRDAKIYAASPGSAESEIGEGKGCTLTLVNGKKVYAWTNNGTIVIRKPEGTMITAGSGSQPIIKALNAAKIACVWESDNQIHAAVLDL